MEQTLRERYQKMKWQHQLGNMASTLARIANNALVTEHDGTVKLCLREAACFIEWLSPQAPPELLLELAAMQRELLTWQQLWPLEKARGLLALQARHQSDRMLQIAGFYELQGPAQQAHAPDAATPQ
jgi:hypothetical protein